MSLSAFPALDHSAKRADDADESAAVAARVALGCAFLIVAGTAYHGISFAKRLGHWRRCNRSWRDHSRSEAGETTPDRNGQSTLRAAFHNAFCGLQPLRQPVRPCFLPPLGDRRQATLLAFTLETEPTIRELVGNHDVTAKRTPATIGGLTAIGQPLGRIGLRLAGPSIHFAPLGRGGCYQPDLPTLAPGVIKRPITHCASSIADSALWFKLRRHPMQSRCQKPPYLA